MKISDNLDDGENQKLSKLKNIVCFEGTCSLEDLTKAD